MKQFLSFLLTLSFLPVLCQAQTETSLPDKQIMESPNIQPLPDTLKSDSAKFSIPSPVPQSSIYRPFGMYGLSPLDYGYASWELHQGFNASIGLHVTFSPSKYAPSGAGFGQDAAFMYALPLTKRFSVAGGVYASNMNWGFINYRQVGIAAVAAFQVNDRISLYAYGNKSLMPTVPSRITPCLTSHPTGWEAWSTSNWAKAVRSVSVWKAGDIPTEQRPGGRMIVFSRSKECFC